MTTAGNRLRGRVDGALHLLDRQVVDADGRLLGKADDIELTETPDGLEVTSLLTGPAALLPRVAGGRARTVLERWRALRPSEPGRTLPWRIDLALVERLDSAFHLSVRRDGVLVRDREHRRLSTLTELTVIAPDGPVGRVLDARFEADPGGRLLLHSLLVGRGRPGSLLGYDRRTDQGPALVRGVVRRLHRHTAIVPAANCRIDWDAGTVVLAELPRDPPGHPFEQ